MKLDYRTNELFKFIKLIPESILVECIENFEFSNRTERRNFDRIKTIDGKIKTLLQNVNYRVDLVEKLHKIYNNKLTFDDTISYNQILATITESNSISLILYILHRCCDDDYDKENFDNFIQSEQFQKTIKKQWTESLNKNMKKETEKGDNEMIYYLGYIELRRTYYNFHPQYIFDSDKKTIQKISKNILSNKFPIYGSLNLAYERFKDSHDFLGELDVEEIDNETRTQRSNTIYAVALKDEDIEDNDDEKIQKKLDLKKLMDSGVDLKKVIIPVSQFKMYKIVTSKEELTDESFSGIILINENDYHSGDDVLLEYGNNLFGPYKLEERPIDGEKYVRPDSGLHKYILQYFDETAYEFMSYEKEYHYEDSTYTDLAYIRQKPQFYDAISDSILLSKLKDDINTDLLKSNPEEFEQLYSTSPFLGDVSDEIRKGRIARILSILNRTEEFNENKNKALLTLVNSLGDKIFELLGDKVKESKLYKDLNESAQKLQSKNDELSAEKEKLEERNGELNQKISDLEEKTTSSNSSNISDDQIEALERENARLKETLSVCESIDELKEKCRELDRKYEDKQNLYDNKLREVDKKQKELESIQNQVQTFIKDELNKADATKMLRVAFDPYVSNAMIEAASNYRAESECDGYEKIAEEMLQLPCKSIERQDLIDMLVAGVQKFRNYKKNDIINMYICLSQGFLTVFSGEPGTGKTSICNILANSLGLNLFENSTKGISKNRFVPVSVERGWSTKRDLIGYFNPLTKKYDRSNAKIYDGLMILDKERNNSRFPYIILLDEANLSPMEYYWADFMRAADKTDEDILINIGLEEEIFIPSTLHFLATINNDQTTEQLSPRLIDRAWIIKLPKTSILETTERIDSYFNTIISWSDIERAFVKSESKEIYPKLPIEQIYKLFDEHHLSVSPRVQQSIKNYICVAQEIMEDEVGVCSKKEKALDFAIVQKLLPKINGYYKDYERLFSSLKQICDENNMIMTKKAITSMEESQDQNMGYCQYLI